MNCREMSFSECHFSPFAAAEWAHQQATPDHHKQQRQADPSGVSESQNGCVSSVASRHNRRPDSNTKPVRAHHTFAWNHLDEGTPGEAGFASASSTAFADAESGLRSSDCRQ